MGPMPSARQPTLHLHATGQWYTRWGGRTHYFGADKALAEAKFLDPEGRHDGALVHWLRVNSRRSGESAERRRVRRSSVRVHEMVEGYLAALEGKGRAAWTLAHNRGHLRRFANTFGAHYTHELSGELLEAWGIDLRRLGLSPKTITHDIACVRAMLKWAARRKMVTAEALLEAQLLERPRLTAHDPVALELAQIHRAIERVSTSNPKLAWSIELLFLTAMRPGELVRVSRGEGRWTPVPPAAGIEAPERCILSLAEHKTVGRTGEMRRLVLCGRAVELVDRLHAIRPPGSPRWPSTNAIGKAFRDAGVGFQPKDLRSSAATHLRWAGAAQADAGRFLGHKQPGELPTYLQEAWPALLASADRLFARFAAAKPGP